MAMSLIGLLQPLLIPDKVWDDITMDFIEGLLRSEGFDTILVVVDRLNKPKQWVKWLPWAEYWYNTLYHTTTQSTPFWLLYGRDPPPLVRYGHGSTIVSSVEHMLEERDGVLEELKLNLHKAQDQMRATANRKRHEEHYDVGDLVYLKLQLYCQKSLAKRRNEKLSPWYYGPFPIEAQVGMVAYRLTLLPSSTIHPMFHVSQLRKAVGTAPTSSSLPSQLTAEMELLVEPRTILGVRQCLTGSTFVTEVLVQWKDLLDFEATWESFATIQNQFPEFHLVDKVAVMLSWIRLDCIGGFGAELARIRRKIKKRKDDIILVGSDEDKIAILKKCLAAEFEIKDLSSLQCFLGMEVTKLKKGIIVIQKKYVVDLLEETGMSGCRTSDTPMDPNLKLGELTEGVAVEIWKAAIGIANNPVQHNRMKHVEIDRHFIKEKLESGIICMSFVTTGQQIADVLTKSLSRLGFETLVNKLDMINIYAPT
ncbi:hypothetical protein AAG906_013806 [Vitis piasezkii]